MLMTPYAATTIYTSDNGAFVFNAERVPTGLNAAFFAVTDVIFPQTVPYHTTLAANFANALGGNVAAQDACRFALMKLTAELNGHTVLPDNGSAVYTMVMKSPSWYGLVPLGNWHSGGRRWGHDLPAKGQRQRPEPQHPAIQLRRYVG